MSRRRPKRSERPDRDDEPVLFDLPLDPPERPRRPPETGTAERAAAESPAEAAETEAPTLFDDAPPASDETPAAIGETPATEPPRAGRAAPAEPASGPRLVSDPETHEPRAEPARVTLAARYLAGLADLAIHAGVAVLLLVGARLLGVAAGYEDWPAVVLFLLVFSFLYSVLPLAFWGQTPGMAWADLVARARGDLTLTFGQTARRWIGGLLTVALLGLPTLLAVAGGRSLADRLSGSELRARE